MQKNYILSTKFWRYDFNPINNNKLIRIDFSVVIPSNYNIVPYNNRSGIWFGDSVDNISNLIFIIDDFNGSSPSSSFKIADCSAVLLLDHGYDDPNHNSNPSNTPPNHQTRLMIKDSSGNDMDEESMETSNADIGFLEDQT